MYKLRVVENSLEKHNILEKCDDAFMDSILKREDFNSLFKKIDDNAVFLVAYNGDDVLGYMAIYCNDATTAIAYITLIAVRPEYQNMHIGGGLMSAGEKIAFDRGMKQIKLEVNSNNSNAIRFYQKHGFTKISDAGKDSFYMQKDL